MNEIEEGRKIARKCMMRPDRKKPASSAGADIVSLYLEKTRWSLMEREDPSDWNRKARLDFRIRMTGATALKNGSESSEDYWCLLASERSGAAHRTFSEQATAGARRLRTSPSKFVGTENILQDPACWGFW